MTHTCELCTKVFTTKSGLSQHMRRKTPCKPLLIPSDPIDSDFNKLSKGFNSSLSKEDRQEQGIFFTPKKVRDILFTKLKELKVNSSKILEPSFGSGEFLFDAKELYPTAEIFGVEKNEKLFNSVKTEFGDKNLVCMDFLDWTGEADLIIGNPPYFIMKTDGMTAKEKKDFALKNSEAMTGRPNIYILFLYKCIKEHLMANGHLAFIIPTSLYNCSYYQPMRNYIQTHCTIKYLETLYKPGFYQTDQDTMLIILQKNKVNDDYIYHAKNGNVYISPYYKDLYDITHGTKTLKELELGVKTGNIVWNQVKDKLTDDESETLLIYSSNIKNSELKLDNLLGKEKKQYISGIDKPTISGPVILVERGYGNVFRFNAVKVDLDNFYAENHINIIYPLVPSSIEKLDKVIKSFNDERTKQFIEKFIGNGSMSATELETLIPIF